MPAPAMRDCFAGNFQLLAFALILLAALWAYHNSFTGAFVFDDQQRVVENPTIRHLWPPWEILAHSSRPVVALSLAVNYAVSGLNVRGYHLFNLVVHILAALVLYGVVRRTLLNERLRPQFGAAASGLALAVALLWVVHPLQTESVTYVIQRGESLMGLFCLLTLYCVIRSNGSARAGAWQVGAVTSCALGMASKPVMVTAPVVVWLYDRVFLEPSARTVGQQRRMMYAGLAATWLLLLLLLSNGQREWKSSAGIGFGEITPARYALTQPGAILHYIRLAFWPYSLCLDYGWPPAQTAGALLLALLVVCGLLLATVCAWRRHPAFGFLGVWFFIILAPTSSFVPIADPIFEHRMYLPLAALLVALVIAVFLVGKHWLKVQPKLGRALGWGLSGVVACLFVSLTVQRNNDYRSEVAIWQDTVEKRPENFHAHNNLGNALLQAGKTDDAMAQYQEALRIRPGYAEAHYNLGLVLQKTGRMPEAIGQYERALRIRPDYPEAHYNLGLALARRGRIEEAIDHWEQAVRGKPDFAEAHNNLGVVLEERGGVQEAMAHYEQALRSKPDYAEAHYNLGVALARLGRLPEAIGHYEEALRIRSDYAEAHNGLGVALVRLGRVPEAMAHWEQALRLKPDFAEAHYNLGIALAQVGKVPEAIVQFEQVLRIEPDSTRAQNALARLQAR